MVRVAEIAHPQPLRDDRRSVFRWHGVHQFLRGEISTAHLMQTGFALFVKTTLSLRYGGVDGDSPLRVPACQMDPCCSDHAVHADNT